ncbi:MAG: helix-turn-helix transcriptional regulator [Clostridia bacterium]|nr:helix-turn-helix transcriptional regulator [Clostridia bacterium]
MMNLDEIIIRIKQIRDKANLSARELSLMLGKNPSYITKLEDREFNPPMQIILEIIECCNSTTEEFFYHNILAYEKDKKLLDYFNKLNDKQKEAILNLFN